VRVTGGGRAALGGACVALLALLLELGIVATPAQGTFPGSPGLIALQRSADPNASDIWVLDWQTGAARRLTHKGYNAEPSFSPNGRWIAFRSDASWHGYLNIWAVRTDGSGRHRLTKGKGELGADSPAFSANGRWVAFSAEGRRGGRQIERVALSGGHRQVLVPERGKVSASSPTYSPDGRHLAWVGWRESRRAVPHIYIGRPNGRAGRRLTTGVEPQFSPDGRSIVFRRVSNCGSGRLGTEIDTLSLDTGRLSELKASCGVSLDAPTYSPDGSWIAYTVYSGERSELGFVPAPLTTPSFTPLAGLGTDLAVDEAPSWQPVP
jgi:Tol biopolymer transport system component